jgi:hypothetical protein
MGLCRPAHDLQLNFLEAQLDGPPLAEEDVMKISGGSIRQRASMRVASALALAVVLGFWPLRTHAACVGDCDMSGEVAVNELIVMVNIALGIDQVASCAAGDLNGDGQVSVDEIITGVNNLLSGCRAEPTPTPSGTAPLTPTSTATPTATEPPTPTESGVLPVAEAIARDADGVATHLGQTVTTEGVVTVSAGIFANNKLKIFAQDGGAGIMVYHQNSANVDAFQTGQRLRATGVIRQQDPTSDANPAIGTVAVDITQGSAVVLSNANPLPEPQLVTLATLNASGTAYTGTLLRVEGVHKAASGNWPLLGSRSTQVDISDDGGTAVLRFQRNTITPQLVQKLNAIGDGAFTLTGIVVQDDKTNDGKLLTGFEIWVREADDIIE